MVKVFNFKPGQTITKTFLLFYNFRGTPVPKFIDPVFANISPKRSFPMAENERFRLVFAKTECINSGTEQ